MIDSEELAKHQQEGDLWVAVRGKVYDVSEFINRHPGGVAILKAVAGKDVTQEFESYHAYINADAWVCLLVT
jgi:cytochrome b involved in lipid metabolism